MQPTTRLAALTLLLTLSFQPSAVFAQGSLTPPGAPAPTMKTLAQVEARTAITNSGAVVISAPGSYYLTTNITVASGTGINITVNDVTLDLNGFTITSTQTPAGTGAAISLSYRTNISIYNGHIRSGVTNNGGTFSGTGFGNGIHNYSGNGYNVRVRDVSVAGVLYNGIYLGTSNATLVTGCAVNGAGDDGIYAERVLDSTAADCGGPGISALTAQNSRGYCNGTQSGLSATTALNCCGFSQSGSGVNAVTAMNCYGESANGIGISATVANSCVARRVGGTAINATIAIGCYATSGLVNAANKYNMP